MSSLEDAIRTHAAAIEKLAAALTATGTAAPSKKAKETVTTTLGDLEKTGEVKPDLRPAKAAEPVKTEAAKPAPAEKVVDDVEKMRAEGKTLMLKVIAKTNNREAGIKLLEGAANVSALDPAKLPKFIESCKAVLAS